MRWNGGIRALNQNQQAARLKRDADRIVLFENYFHFPIDKEGDYPYN